MENRFLSRKMPVCGLTIIVWILTVATSLDAQSFVCNPPTTDPKAPLMQGTPLEYQARVEVSVLEQNYSVVLDEYLDYEGGRGALYIHSGGGSIQKLIFSYSTDEVFDIKDQNCQVYTVASYPYSFLFVPFGNISTADRVRTFGSMSIIRLASSIADKYNGTGIVRGIPADVWSNCLTWPNTIGKIKGTYYFSQHGWYLSSPFQLIPLRVELEGVATVDPVTGAPLPPSQTSAYFHHIYDFIDVIPFSLKDPSIFLTPPKVVCSNRQKTKSPPSFATYFRYRAEIVDPEDSYLTHYAVWYDETLKLLREDTRTITTPTTGTPTITNRMTEIHDFNTGIRYVIDHMAGCTVSPIDTSDTTTDKAIIRFHFNGTLVVDIRDPNSFFFFNDNYTYTGQQTIRGVTCDIFSAIVQDYPIENSKVNATFEYAFLAENWGDLPINGLETLVQNYPVQLVISVPSISFERTYNFFEFAEDHATYPTFDVTSCFDGTQKLGFQLTFPGDFVKGSQEQWTTAIFNMLTETMNVFPLRVGGITTTYDDDNVYVDAYVLVPSSSAQFEKEALALEHENDKMVKGVTRGDECAALCVNNDDFICESYQYCPDDAFACRLSKSHSPTKAILKNATACNGFSRIVKIATKKEPLVQEAYNLLLDAVADGNVKIQITGSQGSAPTTFTAFTLQLTSGEVVASKPLPTLPSAFFYRLETVVPNFATAEETFVWYDHDLSLVRYDNRDDDSTDSPAMTFINDFNLGVSYVINQVTQACKVMPLSSSGVFDITTGTPTKNGGLVLSMKSPNGLFFLDDTYNYIGQSEARGILCDVFESQRNDFHLDYYNLSSQNSVFRYYFQADDWHYDTPQATSSTRSQPVQLIIEDLSIGTYVIYNFYDFTEQHFAASFYDASSCYTPDEKKSFIIVFRDQPYHPLLDQVSNTFLNTALIKMAEYTYSSPINFQGASVTYDDNDVYLIVTALGHTSPLDLFSPIVKVAHNTTAPQIYTVSLEDCAKACVSTNSFICNSFDYCQDNAKFNCLLGTTHAESQGDPITSTGPCMHYSRTENGTYPAKTVLQMYQTITDYIYDNKFRINVTLLNGTTVSYSATDVRDDVLLPADQTSAGSALKKFVVIPRAQLNNSLVVLVQEGMSLTDCATLCLQENTFLCQTFDFKFTVGTCRLSDIHPDEVNATSPAISYDSNTFIYSRFYTQEYTKYSGIAFGTNPDKLISSVQSDEICARDCTTNADFTCESFEICTDGTCKLRKTHKLQAQPGDITQNPNCVHYSRNHIFDYIQHKNKVIDGHDDSVQVASDPSVCAEMCSNGEGLPGCASFEVCQVEHGETKCTLSTADPTSQSGLSIQNSLECSLYTLANPRATSPTQSPSKATSPTQSPSKAGTTKTTSKVTQGTGPTQPSQSAGTTKTTSKVTQGTGPTQPSQSAGTGTISPTKRADNSCGGQSSSSDTGARVGIAFGTLFLGLLVGAASCFVFLRYRARLGSNEDATMLQTYNN